MTVSMPHPQTPNPLLEDWTTPFGLPPFERIAPEHFPPAFEAAFAEHKAEIEAIAENPAPPTSRIRSPRFERSGRMLAPHLRRSSSISPQRIPMTRSRRSSAMSRPSLPARCRNSFERRALRADRCALATARRAGLTAEQRRVLERHHLEFRRAGAGLAARGQGAARRNRRKARRARHAIFAERARRRKSLRARARRRRRSRWPARLARAAAAEAARERGFRRQICHHARALRHRAFSRALRAARSARKGLARLARARRKRRCERQSRHRRRNAETARRTRQASRLSRVSPHYRLADTMAKEPARGAGASRKCLGAGARPGAARRGRAARRDRKRGRQFQARALGLALLCRAPAQGRIRSR